MTIPKLSSNNRVAWISLLLLTTTSQVHARTCFNNGFEVRCSGLSNGARIGIAVAIIVVAMIGLLALTFWRRRRARNRNLVYLTKPDANGGYDTQGQTYGQPQYPPQTYAQQPYNNHAAQYTGYDNGYNPQFNPQFNPPPGQPPLVKN